MNTTDHLTVLCQGKSDRAHVALQVGQMAHIVRAAQQLPDDEPKRVDVAKVLLAYSGSIDQLPAETEIVCLVGQITRVTAAAELAIASGLAEPLPIEGTPEEPEESSQVPEVHPPAPETI